jgi:hypothetical protein
LARLEFKKTEEDIKAYKLEQIRKEEEEEKKLKKFAYKRD